MIFSLSLESCDLNLSAAKTVKQNFGGGNTKWEEKSLGSWATSETRFMQGK